MENKFRNTRNLSAFCLFISLVILMATACRHASDPYPTGGDIPDSLMVNIVADMFLIEGTMIQLEYLQERSTEASPAYYDAVYSKYSITREQFLKTLKLYTDNAEFADKLYDRVILKLGEMEATQNKKPADKPLK
jgi:hypothetical protein